MEEENRVRIIFYIEPEWHGLESERLWADPITGADQTGLYRLLNSPFHIKGVSFEDVVFAEKDIDSGELAFVRLVEKSGYSTYVVITSLEDINRSSNWKRMSDIGCTYEWGEIFSSGNQAKIYSISIPPGADIFEAYRLLEEGEKSGEWDFQEHAVGHKV